MPLSVIEYDGNPITRPGLYSNVPIAKYHSGRLCDGPSLSSSGLRKIILESEAHFYDTWPVNPDYDREEAEKASAAFVLGRAAHHLFLGEADFEREFVIEPDVTTDHKGKTVAFSYKFNAAKEWRFVQEQNGLTVLSKRQVEQIKGMSKRLAGEEMIRRGALNGLVEVTMAWKDVSNVWLLSRPDVIPNESGTFTDLKTIGNGTVAYHNLVRAIGEYGYHMQGALVREGFQRLTKRKMETFNLYFIETNRPHCAQLMTLNDLDLDLGWRQCRLGINRFIEAANTGYWPGPGGRQDSVRPIALSTEKRTAIESELRRYQSVP